MQVLVSASREFLAVAVGGLRRYCAGRSSRVLGADTALIDCDGLQLHAIADMCRSIPLPFVRHLSEVRAIGSPDDIVAKAPDILASIPQVAHALATGAPLGFHYWVAEGTEGVEVDGIATPLRGQLEARGHRVVARGYEYAAHLCVTSHGVVLGGAAAMDSLSDWPGGRVRLRADAQMVSRAERKLEEALMVFGIAVPAGGVAFDLGASPGGWTRILSARGFKVHAIDPAELAPSVAADPNVSHERMKAEDFVRSTDIRADLLVNDMRMDPLASCQIMLGCADRLVPGGYGIITLKLRGVEDAKLVGSSLAKLRTKFDVLAARQLYYNRNEITVVVRRTT